MKTAQDFLDNAYLGGKDIESGVIQAMIQFAKMHVEEALKQFLENAETEILCQHGYGRFDEQSVKDAYSLDNIK